MCQQILIVKKEYIKCMVAFFTQIFSDHISIHNRLYLIQLCKTQVKTKETSCRTKNVEMENNEFK